MPLLRLQINTAVADSQRAGLLAELSQTVAKLLSKPESYMMVVVEPETAVLFGGSDEPAGFFEVRSLGAISAEQALAISKAVSALLQSKLEIAPDRVYSNYQGWERSHWGFNGGTF